MTTTAHEDQFGEATETHIAMYSIEEILRRNVAALEIELQRQRERADAAEAELLAVRDDNHSMMLELASARDDLQSWIDSRNEWMGRAQAAEQELKAAREHEPVKYLYRVIDCFGNDVLRDDPRDATILETIPLYARPIPAPAVPEEWLKCWLIESPASSEWPAIWLTITTDGRRWVSDGGTMYATGGDWYFTSAAGEALKFADKESADEYVRHNKIKDVVVTEHIFDARALVQSAQPVVNPDRLPNCRTCANRGQVNGLSQESFCESCVYQGRDWRKNHYMPVNVSALTLNPANSEEMK